MSIAVYRACFAAIELSPPMAQRISGSAHRWLRRMPIVVPMSMVVQLTMFNPVIADDVTIPLFWDLKEVIVEPDLGTLPRVRFLTTTDFPPFNYIDPDGQLGGFNIDLARAICAELDLADRCAVQALPRSELETALGKGVGEAIIAGLAVTEQARAKFAFSRSYMRFPARFVAQENSAFAEPSDPSMRGRRVGVVANSVHEKFLRDDFPAFDIATYPDIGSMLSDLRNAKLDAAFGDGMRLSLWLSGDTGGECCRFAGGAYVAPDILGGGLAIAVSKDHPEYAAAFDAALQQISAKGTYAELYLRYFPVSFY